LPHVSAERQRSHRGSTEPLASPPRHPPKKFAWFTVPKRHLSLGPLRGPRPVIAVMADPSPQSCVGYAERDRRPHLSNRRRRPGVSRLAGYATRTNPRRPGASCPGVTRLASYPRSQTRRRPGASCPGVTRLASYPRSQTRRRPGASCPGVTRLASYPRSQTRRRPGASCPGVTRLVSYLHAPNLRRPSPPRSLSSGAFRGRHAPRWASSRHGLEFRAGGSPRT
jgi:hypothetical protein